LAGPVWQRVRYPEKGALLMSYFRAWPNRGRHCHHRLTGNLHNNDNPSDFFGDGHVIYWIIERRRKKTVAARNGKLSFLS